MTFRNRQRLKLLALIAVFVVPLVSAWAMVEWRVGIPQGSTAHGELEPQVPPLARWPLREPLPPRVADDWLLAFDCSRDCEALADQWWRMHRALGRDADRVSRLRIGGETEPLPGESVAHWQAPPAWREPARLWLLDPGGRVVLGYAAGTDPYDVLEDLERLLKVNPESSIDASHPADAVDG